MLKISAGNLISKGSRKMNKAEIKELVDLFQLTSDTAKSCVNRFEASLSKTGSASSRLSMVGSSILKLAEQSPEDDQPTLEAIGNMARFFAHVAVDNKKAQTETKPKKSRKTGWENLKDADSIPTPKIRKETKPTKRDLHEMVDQAQELMNDTEFLRVLAREIESAQAHRR